MNYLVAVMVASTLTAASASAQGNKAPEAAAQEAAAQAKAAQRLADLLKPGNAADAALSLPLPRLAPVAIEQPQIPLSVFRGLPPALAIETAGSAKLRHPAEGAPLARYRAAPVVPELVELATLPAVRIPSVDVRQPVALPILARPVGDRASLADPTLDESIAAALAKVSAQRAGPVPFSPLNLPDPFEHAQTVRLGYTPQELPIPPPLALKTPRP